MNEYFRPICPVDAVGGEGPLAAFGTKRLVSSYQGPAINVVNPVSGKTTDIGFLPDGGIDLIAMWNAIPDAPCLRVAKVYDQVGNHD